MTKFDTLLHKDFLNILLIKCRKSVNNLFKAVNSEDADWIKSGLKLSN